MSILNKYVNVIDETDPIKYIGKVNRIVGLTIESLGPQTEIGELCKVISDHKYIYAEVVGFKNEVVILMPYGEMSGIYPGCDVIATGYPLSVKVGDGLKGRILSGVGRPLDDKEEVSPFELYHTVNKSPNVLKRDRIKAPLSTGVKAIDGLTTVGKGQRLGIFSGTGVGKSTLLGMIARHTSADVNVIALIGERGREVRDFIEKNLGEEGLSRSVVVVATSDSPALMRIKGAFVATSIAEYFRDQGLDVLLMMDSVTRFARAQRELGLAIGEPPSSKGYPPSVFDIMPKLMERAGTSDKGTITGFYTVLVEGDDFNEPISDNVRGILDGHISLSRNLANKNYYPAIDILDCISRLMIDIVSPEVMNYSNKIREIVATYREVEDLINIGAYAKGSNPKVDYAISMIDKVTDYFRQDVEEGYNIEATLKGMFELFGDDSFSVSKDIPNYLTEE